VFDYEEFRVYRFHEAENFLPNEFTNKVDKPYTGTIINKS
jgi:hypothetical protein